MFVPKAASLFVLLGAALFHGRSVQLRNKAVSRCRAGSMVDLTGT